MTFKPTTLERAYQLAAGAACRTASDVKRALKSEGYNSVDEQLYGISVARALRSLCKEHYRQAEVVEA